MIRLTNVHTIDNNSESIIIDNKNSSSASIDLDLDNAIAFPGLINSHDHLEFNLFPQLGNKIYESYMEWGPDIHEHNKEIIRSVLKIPKELRSKWGVYKNLLAGITTVVQHGEKLLFNDNIINIYQDCYSLHSVKLEKYWKLKLNKPFTGNKPYAIHAGEGTNEASGKEIDELIKWNILNKKIVAVHGIAMNTQQAKAFDALVWCPDSNFFLYNATAKIGELKKHSKILFGTDSTLSANWNIWQHLRLARSTGMLTDEELYQSLTTAPATIWNLSGSGIEKNNPDIVIAKKKITNNWFSSFFSLNPEDILMICREGNIVLFDDTLLAQLAKNISTESFSKIYINSACKFVKGDLPILIKQIKQYDPTINFPVEIAE